MDLDILRRSPLFATLDDAAFKLLTDDIQEIDLSRNAVLFYEGDQGDQLFAVLSGKVKLGRTAADGREDLVFSDVPGRLAKALLDLADRFGRPATDGILVAHELTQEELAQLVGASRETVNKALAEFVSRGWIRLEARAVVILDLPRLRQRSR